MAESLSLKTVVTYSYSYGFGEPLIAFFLQKALVFLHNLHSRYIEHGGIKASNIFLEADGSVNVRGIFSDLTRPSSTISYQTPMEFYLNPNLSYSSTTDIWYLGILGYEIAKYSGRQSRSLLRMSDEFKNFIGQCLSETASERPYAFQLLQHPLFQIYENSIGNPNFGRGLYQGTAQRILSRIPPPPRQVFEDEAPIGGADIVWVTHLIAEISALNHRFIFEESC